MLLHAAQGIERVVVKQRRSAWFTAAVVAFRRLDFC